MEKDFIEFEKCRTVKSQYPFYIDIMKRVKAQNTMPRETKIQEK